MKKFITLTIGALVAFTVAASSIAAPAYAGKKERRIAAGIILGAVGGAIIAGEINRSRKYRRSHRRSYRSNRHYRSYSQRRVNRHRYYNDRRYYNRAPRVYYERPRSQRRYYKKRRKNTRRLSRYQRHVKRCYAAYRSYDARSGTFIGYDGIERKCRK